jgi:ATP-dependent exoDNAse (exonuclease V) alpha subunit
MFVKNNLRLGYSNGTSGKVISFDNNGYPNIELNNGKILNGIEKDDFYREDEYGNRLATIKQIPLKLAWAITIHKSQGMTLDKVTIDLTNAFTSGQGYVALSRVRSINDISLIGLNKIALTVSQEALNIENELQEKSKQALKCLTIEKPDISSNPDIIVEPPPIIDRIKIVNLITYWIANKLREFIK